MRFCCNFTTISGEIRNLRLFRLRRLFAATNVTMRFCCNFTTISGEIRNLRLAFAASLVFNVKIVVTY
jgi:hypothetical protein